MSKRRTAVGAALAGLATAGAVALGQPPVHADPAPRADDVVGVGSDIIQNSVNFLADGYHGLPGYNTAGNKNRLFNYDSVGDANGRNSFSDPLLGTATDLKSTVVLRAGTSPVRRPNGGNAGINALLNDGNATSGGRIQFARTPNAPTQAQLQTASTTAGVGALRTVQFAQDYQYIATATTTNAPASGLTADDILKIYNGTYKHWNEIPGNQNGSAEQIVPLIPQNGAGVRTIFLNTVKAATGQTLTPDTDATDGYSVKEVQQNDPSTITSLPAEQQRNAIVPFPQGRYTLLGDGFFYPAGTQGGALDYNSNNLGTPLSNAGIHLLRPGQGGVAAGAYKANIPYYVLIRQSDLTSSKPWQPGSTLNWAQTLFANENWDADSDTVPPPFVASAAGKAIIEALGLEPKYQLFDEGYHVG